MKSFDQQTKGNKMRNSERAERACLFWLAAPAGTAERQAFSDAKEYYLAAQETKSTPLKESYAHKARRRFIKGMKLLDERIA